MAKAANVKLKCNPQLGNLPALQWALVSQLQVDQAYQRNVEGPESQGLIRRIAQHWNWDLCQPLVVSRRPTGAMFVIDGQHRLCAARLRGDVHQLPCVVVDYAGASAEAASFVHLNQQRRALSALDVFKAAVAGEDPEAMAILAAIERAGLALAPHTNPTAWEPGMVANVSGIQAAWRKHGEGVTTQAMGVLAQAWPDEVLIYAGTLFAGVVDLLVQAFTPGEVLALLRTAEQWKWRSRMLQVRADSPQVPGTQAMGVAFTRWGVKDAGGSAGGQRAQVAAGGSAERDLPALINFTPLDDGRAWCSQCERRRHKAEAAACQSQFCVFKPKVAATMCPAKPVEA